MDKNQFKKKLSLISKTIDHHLNYRSPTKAQSSILNNNNNEPIKSSLSDELNSLSNKSSSLSNSTDQNALGEKIFKDFTNIFEKDGNIIEFDLIDVDDNLFNKSPVKLVDHHIAIERWCVKQLHNYLYNQLLDHNTKRLLLSDEDLKRKTRLMLLLNSKASFVWNLRKVLVEDGLLGVDEDLKFCQLVLKSTPKSPEAFMHRGWLLNYLEKQQSLTDEYLVRELEVCLDSAGRYSSNYYAWNHRYNLVSKFFSKDLDFLLEENELIKKWINNHISDYSGYHYKQMIISILFKILLEQDRKDKLIELLNNENLNLRKLIQIYPEQEALFCHKRNLLKLKHINLGLTDNDIREEKEFVQSSYKLAKKFDYNWLVILIHRYVKWLEYNCKISIDVKDI